MPDDLGVERSYSSCMNLGFMHGYAIIFMTQDLMPSFLYITSYVVLSLSHVFL